MPILRNATNGVIVVPIDDDMGVGLTPDGRAAVLRKTPLPPGVEDDMAEAARKVERHREALLQEVGVLTQWLSLARTAERPELGGRIVVPRLVPPPMRGGN